MLLLAGQQLQTKRATRWEKYWVALCPANLEWIISHTLANKRAPAGCSSSNDFFSLFSSQPQANPSDFSIDKYHLL